MRLTRYVPSIRPHPTCADRP
jgi:14-3-3 protein epsilon